MRDYQAGSVYFSDTVGNAAQQGGAFVAGTGYDGKGFDPNTTTAQVSADTLVATGVAFVQASVKSIISHSGSGKFYLEFKRLAHTTDGALYGIAGPDYDPVAGTGKRSLYYDNDGNIYTSATSNVLLGISSAVNDVICVAVDLTNLKVWFRLNGGNWNASGTANPASNTGGITIESTTYRGNFGPVDPGEKAQIYTAEPFNQARPSGFQPWTGVAADVSSGLQVTVTVGNVTVTTISPNVSVPVTGQSVTVSVGTVTTIGKATASVTGLVLTTALGSAIIQLPGSTGVAGQTIVAQVGDVVVRASGIFPITGTSAAVSVGTVTVAFGVTQAVDGFALTTATNDVGLFMTVLHQQDGLQMTASLGHVLTVGWIETLAAPSTHEVWRNVA